MPKPPSQGAVPTLEWTRRTRANSSQGRLAARLVPAPGLLLRAGAAFDRPRWACRAGRVNTDAVWESALRPSWWKRCTCPPVGATLPHPPTSSTPSHLPSPRQSLAGAQVVGIQAPKKYWAATAAATPPPPSPPPQ